jgi:hypothetical protein
VHALAHPLLLHSKAQQHEQASGHKFNIVNKHSATLRQLPMAKPLSRHTWLSDTGVGMPNLEAATNCIYTIPAAPRVCNGTARGGCLCSCCLQCNT